MDMFSSLMGGGPSYTIPIIVGVVGVALVITGIILMVSGRKSKKTPQGQRPPQQGYGAPPQGQRPPQQGYGAPPQGQRPPQQGYGVPPQQGYSAPAQQSPPPQSPPQPQVAPVLVGRSGLYNGQKFQLTSARLVMGRDPSRCNIVFPEGTPGISSIHCQVWYDPSQSCFFVQDSGSTYGTYLANGSKLPPNVPQKVNPGGTFYLANSATTFCAAIE